MGRGKIIDPIVLEVMAMVVSIFFISRCWLG